MPTFIPEQFINEKVKIFQPENGYRFSMDSVILSAHVKFWKAGKLLDIGTGSGIMAIILALKYPDIHITGVEIQKELASIANNNVILNHMEKNISILEKDIRQTEIDHINGAQDIIIANPPYRKTGSFRINPNIQKAIARHEMKLSLAELAKSVKRLLSSHGKFYIIYPAERLSNLISTLCHYKIEPDEIRFIHTKKNAAAKRVIIKCINNGGQPVKILPPLYIYKKGNTWSNEATAMFNT